MNLKALIIDDEIHICALLRAMLTSLGVIVLGDAATGEEGLILFEKYKPDLVFLDLNLLGLSGEEVLQAIKKASAETKVIILSAINDRATVVRLAEKGADYYIVKDASPDKLLLTLKETVERFQS